MQPTTVIFLICAALILQAYFFASRKVHPAFIVLCSLISLAVYECYETYYIPDHCSPTHRASDCIIRADLFFIYPCLAALIVVCILKIIVPLGRKPIAGGQ